MAVLDLIFPIRCLECGLEGKYLCDECLSKVRLSNPSCIECHRFAIRGYTHKRCKRLESVDRVHSLWNYDGIIRRAILALKYKFAYKVADELAQRSVEKLKKEGFFFAKDVVLIPIPLHRQRKNWRGFNQAEEIGKIIACAMKWNYKTNAIKRLKKTIPQTELKQKERAKNVIGAFSFLHGDNLKSKNVVLFDDVLTTGSTIREAGKVLKQNGVKTVWGLSVASK